MGKDVKDETFRHALSTKKRLEPNYFLGFSTKKIRTFRFFASDRSNSCAENENLSKKYSFETVFPNWMSFQGWVNAKKSSQRGGLRRQGMVCMFSLRLIVKKDTARGLGRSAQAW